MCAVRSPPCRAPLASSWAAAEPARAPACIWHARQVSQVPSRPPRPKHVPFWPWLIAFAFLIAVVVAGVISSNHARKDNAGEKLAESATSTTLVSPEPTVTTITPKQVIATGTDTCTDANLRDAAVASGQVDQSVLGTITVPKFVCIQGYALASLTPSRPDQQSVLADYKLVAGHWKLLNLGGAIDPASDGVPKDVAPQLKL